MLRDFFQPDVWRDDQGPADDRHLPRRSSPTQHAPESPEEYVNHSLYLEAKTFLHGLFVVEDKLSMAHSLESRVPFLDNDLVDFAQRVPVRLKLRDLEHVVQLDENAAEPEERALLRAHARRQAAAAPGDAALRPRARSPTRSSRGSPGPDASWFRGDSIDYVRRLVLNDDAAMYEFLEPGTCARARRRPPRGPREPAAAAVVAADASSTGARRS